MVTLLFSLTALFSTAQNLDLSQLKSYLNQPVLTVSDSLTKNKWTVRPELSGIQAHQMYQTFSFGNQQDEQAKALAWLRIHADHNIVNQLYYQLPNIEQYNLVLKEIKETGTEKKGVQNIEDNQINTYYLSADYTFQTITGANSYTIMVMTNKQP